MARLYQAGYPVPDGFVILSTAFANDELTPGCTISAKAWTQIQTHLNHLREINNQVAFAVRSSAMNEDSVQASFAGEFETVLNVRTDEDIRKAIQTVHHSRQNERVQAYSEAKGLSTEHEIAVVIQQLVHAESSGVLFPANPITGQRDQAMVSASWAWAKPSWVGWRRQTRLSWTRQPAAPSPVK
ncbi:MAG: hypothetical protein GY832_40425 [Chloroflexi bacterium]|nr:hypothetical protein [Chloroflexota bacterium]